MKNPTLLEFALNNHIEKILDDCLEIPSNTDIFTYIKHEGYQYKLCNKELERYLKKIGILKWMKCLNY